MPEPPDIEVADTRQSRMAQGVLIVSTLVVSWLGMQAVHELGHVIGAGLTGGEVERVVLHPLTISRTDVLPNPHPLIVVWAGPLIGALLPVLCWLVAAGLKWSGAFVVRFFAGFCLVANGLYISVGSFWHVGDCGVMLGHGSSNWQLWLFGIITVPVGFAMWNGQGKHFGLGSDATPVSSWFAWGTCAVALALVMTGVIVGGD